MKQVLVLSIFLLFVQSSSAAEDKGSAVPSKVIKIGNPAPADAPVKETEVSAKKYEFAPDVIEARVNSVTRIS